MSKVENTQATTENPKHTEDQQSKNKKRKVDTQRRYIRKIYHEPTSFFFSVNLRYTVLIPLKNQIFMKKMLYIRTLPQMNSTKSLRVIEVLQDLV